MFEDLPNIPPIRTVLLPSADTVFVTRALVKDSWLTYADALPPDEGMWADLTQDVLNNILALGKALSAMHRHMKHYKGCEESPFHVTRWWDPSGDDGFQSGRFCLFKFKDRSHQELVSGLPRQSPLKLVQASPRTPHWVEATIPVQTNQLEVLPAISTEPTGLGRPMESILGARL